MLVLKMKQTIRSKKYDLEAKSFLIKSTAEINLSVLELDVFGSPLSNHSSKY